MNGVLIEGLFNADGEENNCDELEAFNEHQH